jgi:L-amino acid N-acyltransferase YncA
MMEKLYTASEAREKLGGMSSSSFKRLVDAKKIRKVVPPGKTQGKYIKEDVDKLAEAMEQFVEIYSASEPAEHVEFVQARDEEDIRETVQIAHQHFGDNAYGLEKRMTWFRKIPNGDYILKHEGVIVGYFSAQAIKPASVKRIFDRRSGESVQLDDMLPIEPGKPLELHISGIGVKMGISRKQAKIYGMLLLSNLFDTLVELGKQGIDIHKIWVKSSTVPGIKLSRDLGFTELGYINNEQLGFMLDLEKSSRPTIQRYREALREANKSTVQ